MADDAPDVDTLFPAKSPDVDDLFPAHVEQSRKRESLGASPIQDLIFGNADVSPVAHVLNHFGQGFKHGWGAEPLGLSDESNEYLKKSGVFNDYVDGHTSIAKAANESLIRPAAVALDSAWRGMTGAFVGAQEVVAATGRDIENSEGTKVQVGDYTATREPIAKQIGLGKLARDVAALPEAFMGSPHPLGIPPVNLAKAKSLGVIGEGEAGWKGTKEVVPDNLVSEAETAKFERSAQAEPVAGQPAEPAPQLGTPVPEAPPPDVHTVARSIDPETFTKYDALQTRQETFRRWISELRETRDQEAAANAPHAKEIQDTIEKINNPDTTPRLRKKYQARLDDMSEEYQTHIDDAMAKDSPDMAKIRQRLQENDYAMRDLAPNVGKAYQEARSRFPEPEATQEPMQTTAPEQPAPIATAVKPAQATETALPPVQSGFERFFHGGASPESGGGRWVSQDQKYARGYAEHNSGDANAAYYVDIPVKWLEDHNINKSFDDTGTSQKAPYTHFEVPEEFAKKMRRITNETSAPEPVKQSAKADLPSIAHPSIVDDVAQKLVAAGRPVDEAQAAAQIVSEYWKTRAERFKGAKGTAEELYRAESPSIVGEKAQPLPAKAGELEFAQITAPDTPQFKKWFGDSKVTDADGSPRVVYHGTTANFDEFLSAYGGNATGAKSAEKGFFFSSSPEVASSYAVGRNPYNEIPFIRFVNKMTGGHYERFNEAILRKAGKEGLVESGENVMPTYLSIKNPLEIEFKGKEYREQSFSELIDKAKSGSHDGVVFRDAVDPGFKGGEKPSDIYVAFGPEQIKSATGNAGGYNSGSPKIYEQVKRGRIRIREDGRNTITLMKDANASTFIHETGHDWLERLMKDGKDTLAPEDLKADVATVKKWLGVEGDAVKTGQHEKFARAFERYMMEGTAPSKGLANVFEQFKAWLTKIYETVNRLKAPIADDIRDVFDRLLSSKPEKTVIAPEREISKNFADHHEALAETTALEKAHEAAETIQTERDRLAAQHIPEMQDARLEGITAETSRREPGSPQPDGAGNEAGPSTGESGIDAAPGEVRKSGSQTAQEGVGSREVTSPNGELPPPETKLLDKAGNIRLDNLNLPEDVNAVLREAAERNDNFIGARRGVMSDAQALDLADALGMDASNLNMRKIGQAFNAEEILAARKLLIQSATEVRDAMSKAATGTDADVLAYGEAKSRHQMIQEQVAGITAEAGRALRAFRSLDGMKEAQELGALIEQSTGKTLYQLKREAQLGMELDTPQKISKFINDSKRAAFKDMVMEFWINALLSGPMTHVKNIIGNFLVALNSVAETAGAAGVSKIRNIITGADEGVNIGEAKARMFGLMQGAQDGVLAAAKAFKNEESFTVAQTLEQRKFQSIPSVKVNVFGHEMEIGGKQIRLPGRLLTAEDEFFKAIASRQELNVIAYREATKLGLDGEAFTAKVADIVTNPTDEQMLAAKKNSEYQTFTKALGPTGRSIQNFANSHVLAKIVVPFIRTPINLLKYAGERTALGVFSEAVRDNLSGKNGQIAQDTQIARMAMGTMVSVAVAKLVVEDMITGGGPSDPKEKATLMLTGWRPYSIKIGNVYYSYDWADPFSTTIGITADLAEAAKVSTEDDAEISKVGAALLASISKNIMGKASLRGASDLTQAITDPDRYGPKYVQNLAGTVVPSVVAQAARASDPIQREARTALDAIRSRIPILREGLLPRRDIWGEPVVSEGSVGPDMASPIRQSTINNDPVNQALVNLGVWPSKLDRKIRGVELTDQQYDDFSRVAGRMAKMRLNAVVGQAGFSSAPQAIQAQLIKATIDSSRETARSLIMMQNPSIIKDAMDAKLEKLRGH